MATVELGILTVHVPASLHVSRGHRHCCCCSLRRRHGRSIQTSLCVAHGNDESRFVAPSSSHLLKMNRPKKKKACIIHGALANDAGEQQGMSFSMILNS